MLETVSAEPTESRRNPSAPTARPSPRGCSSPRPRGKFGDLSAAGTSPRRSYRRCAEAGGRIHEAWGGRRLPCRARQPCCATTPGGRRPLTECRLLSEELGGVRVLLKRGGPSTTPARTRSTTCSARRCSPSAWARRGSWPRPGPASTASRPATAAALAGHGVRGVHGRGRHEAPRAQRVPHAPPGHRGAHRDLPAVRTLKDAINECHARLGGHRRLDALPARLGHGTPHPYPWMVQRAAARARPGGPASSGAALLADRRGRRGSRTVVSRPCTLACGSNLRWASSRASPTRGRSWWVSSRPAAPPSAAACRASLHGSRATLLQDEWGQVQEAEVDLRRPRLPGGGSGALVPPVDRTGPLRVGDRSGGHRRVHAAEPDGGHHPGARAGARPCLGEPRSGGACVGSRCC